MSDTKTETFRQSLDRCLEDTEFMERFYRYFLASSPAIREKFAKTDWPRQHRMMVDSFRLMVRSQEKGTADDPELWHIAVGHGDHGHKIAGWMYENWLESLIKAVEDTDPDYDENVNRAWYSVMRDGIAFMKARRFEKLDRHGG